MPDTYTPNPFDGGAPKSNPPQPRLKLKEAGSAAGDPAAETPADATADATAAASMPGNPAAAPPPAAPPASPARKPRILRRLLLTAALGGAFGMLATVALKTWFTDGSQEPAARALAAPGAAPVPEENPSGAPVAARPARPAEPPATAEAYLGRLREQRLMLSGNPRGVFINSVFYPEGSELQPVFGLGIGQVLLDGPDPVVEVIDSDGRIHLIPLAGAR